LLDDAIWVMSGMAPSQSDSDVFGRSECG